MTPIPPARAIPIAMSDSVTVSIAADENGTLSGIPRVNSEVVLTSFGWINECRGVRRTSSKVRTTSDLTRGMPSSATVDPLMRESPLPDCAGEAGLVDGRVVVAIAKCMASCGLRPDPGCVDLTQMAKRLQCALISVVVLTAVQIAIRLNVPPEDEAKLC